MTSPDLRIAGISWFRGGRAEWEGGMPCPNDPEWHGPTPCCQSTLGALTCQRDAGMGEFLGLGWGCWGCWGAGGLGEGIRRLGRADRCPHGAHRAAPGSLPGGEASIA